MIFARAVSAQEEETEVPESPFGHLQFMTIHTDGEILQRVTTKQTKGPAIEQEFTVSVPYMEDGVTRMRMETRIRIVLPTIRVLSKIDDDTTFVTIRGDKLEKNDVLSRVPMSGLQVLVLSGAKAEIPDAWKELLKDDVVVVKVVPKP